MLTKKSIVLFIIVLLGLSVAFISHAKKLPKDPPNLKIKRFELKKNSGRGLFAKPDRKLEIVVTNILEDGSTAKGTIKLYNGEKPYKGLAKTISFALKKGKSKTWTLSKDKKISSIDIDVMSGKAKFVIIQPRFILLESKVKKTTKEMISNINSMIFAGYYEGAKNDIEMGVDVNVQDEAGNTPLFIACFAGKTDLVKLILEKGADPNISNIANSTPIIAAANARDNFAILIPLLIDKGAKLDVVAKDGTTVIWPLTYQLFRLNREKDKAVRKQKEKELLTTMELVLKNGADVDAPVEGKRTPLMLAAKSGSLPMVKLLVKYGAKIEAKSDEGETAASLAKEEGYSDIVEFIKKQK
jgi:Ankyrin repeats (3 copies)